MSNPFGNSENPYLTDINKVTVYQIVKYVNFQYGTNIQHGQVMARQMPGLLKRDLFVGAQQFVEHVITSQGRTDNINTYLLDPDQALMTASKISDDVHEYVIRRLRYLENKYEPNNVTSANVVKMITAYTMFKLNVPITTQPKLEEMWLSKDIWDVYLGEDQVMRFPLGCAMATDSGQIPWEKVRLMNLKESREELKA